MEFHQMSVRMETVPVCITGSASVCVVHPPGYRGNIFQIADRNAAGCPAARPSPPCICDLERLFVGVAMLSILGVLLSWAIGQAERRLLSWR